MAHIDDGRGSRSANVEVNIVPVIDLMSVLIVFLLITAVWNQISMIQLGTTVYGKKSSQEDIIKPKALELPLRLDIVASGYVLNVAQNVINIEMYQGDFDTDRLILELKKIKIDYPDKSDIIIQISDDLAYGDMIKGMDAAISAEFPDVSVASGGS